MKFLVTLLCILLPFSTLHAIETQELIAILTPSVIHQLPNATFTYEFPTPTHTESKVAQLTSLMLTQRDNLLHISSVVLSHSLITQLHQSYVNALSGPRTVIKKNTILYPQAGRCSTWEIRHHTPAAQAEPPHEKSLYIHADFLRFNPLYSLCNRHTYTFNYVQCDAPVIHIGAEAVEGSPLPAKSPSSSLLENLKIMTIHSQQNDHIPTLLHGTFDYQLHSIYGKDEAEGLLIVAVKSLMLQWHPKA